MTDRVIVRRAEGQPLGELAAALIALADNPHEVVWEHRAGYLTVPEYVAARYAGGMDDAVPDQDAGGTGAVPDASAGDGVPPKRKPGRPRKAAAAVEEEVN